MHQSKGFKQRIQAGGWSDAGGGCGEGSLFDRHDIHSMKSRSPSHMPWHQTDKAPLQNGEHACVAGGGGLCGTWLGKQGWAE